MADNTERPPCRLTDELLSRFMTTDELGKHAILEAVAGAGKSYMMGRALTCLPSSSKVLVLAFNVENVDALVKKDLPKWKLSFRPTVSTFHSFANSLLGPDSTRRVDPNYKFKAIFPLFPKTKEQWRLARTTTLLVSLIQNLHCGTDDEQELTNLLQKFLAPQVDKQHFPTIVRKAKMYLSILKLTCEDTFPPATIDFDDQLWLPVEFKEKVKIPKADYDWVLIDECQDFNNIQLKLLERLLQANPRTRVLVAGDARQAIYGFRGAVQTIKKIKGILSGISEGTQPECFTLPVCRRCPCLHIGAVNLVLPSLTFEPSPGAPPGELFFCNRDEVSSSLKVDDLVLCRNSKPLLELVFQTLREGKPVAVIGESSLRHRLKDFFKEAKDEKNEAEALINAANSQEQALKKYYLSIGDSSSLGFITDFYDCVRLLVGQYKTSEGVLKFVKDVFKQHADKAVFFSTIHRAKGKTVPDHSTCWLLLEKSDPLPSIQTYEEEEQNLLYVALTRSKNRLGIVTRPSALSQSTALFLPTQLNDFILRLPRT